MKEILVRGYYLPERLRKEVSQFSYSVHEFPEQDTAIRVEFPVVTPAFLARVISFLKNSKAYLEKKTVEEIADILDKASERWLDDGFVKKVSAVDAISLFTGFAPEMVRESIKVEHLSSRKEDLLRERQPKIDRQAAATGD